MKGITCFILFSVLVSGNKPVNKQDDFSSFAKSFVTGYRAFNLPELELAYIENFKAIKPLPEVEKQEVFFISTQKRLQNFNRAELTADERNDYDLVSYETHLNLERALLEKQWLTHKPANIAETGLLSLPGGKAWYAYFLKKWIAADVTPDEIYDFGLREVDRVSKKIEAIRLQTGLTEKGFYSHLNDDSFFYKNNDAVRHAFEAAKKTVANNMATVFNVHSMPELGIQKGNNQALVQAPGYYTDNIFYYNYFNEPYNKRQVDWLFIHEGIPGHHYQLSVAHDVKQSDVQHLFDYPGFSEGWAAYTEELGKQIGLYRTVYDELGKWEWDIVRSVRVPLDVALNYYGWTDEQALAFWKKYIVSQDDIAMREIKRMRRWPAQVVSYKYGALQILEWKEILVKKQQTAFNIRAFHDKVLNSGSLPWFMVRNNVLFPKGMSK